MSAPLGDLSQLPKNIAQGAGPDTVQNHYPASPSTAPHSMFPQAQFPQTQMLPNSLDVTQLQYVTNFTCMFNILANNQVAFQQGIMQLMGQPQAATTKLGSFIKVRNPRMFTGKHEEVTPFLSEVNCIIQFNTVSFPTNNHKVIFLTLYLNDGIPVKWFNHLEKACSPLLHNWSRFVDEFKKKFSDPCLIHTAEHKLDRLVQTSSAHSYLTCFIHQKICFCPQGHPRSHQGAQDNYLPWEPCR